MLREESQVLANVRMDHAVVENTARLIDAAIGGEFGLAAVPVGDRDAFVKRFGGPHDGAFGIANGKGPKVHGDTVAGLVAQGNSMSLDGLTLAHGDRSAGAGPRQVVVVAVGFAEKVIVVRSADDVLAKVPGYAFGAIVPENDFAAPIDDIDGDVQVLQDGAEEVKVSGLRHGVVSELAHRLLSAQV